MSNLNNENAGSFSGNRGRSTLVAFFDSRSDAERAVERLKDAGITNVRLMPGYEADGDKAEVADDDRGSFWAKLEDWLFPDEDREVYAEGLRRGGFLISAEADDANYDTAHDILDDEGSIDMDERADLWRTEGWNARTLNEADAESRYEAARLGELRDADSAEKAGTTQEDVFAANAPPTAMPVGRYTRRADLTSPRVRAYDLDEEVPLDQELRDDILPTGHQHTVEESEDLADRELRQSQDPNSMRQKQDLLRGR